jgi:2-dehydropantoate 2-reductase
VHTVRVLVTGAGIIGTIYGWALSASGHHVVHFVRPGRATRYGNGVPFDIFDRRKGQPRCFRGRYPLHATEAVRPPYPNYQKAAKPEADGSGQSRAQRRR